MTIEVTGSATEEQTPLTLDYIGGLESQYVMNTYKRQPVLFVRGKGSTLYDDQGKAYTDFISGIGVNVLGYDHPVMRRVLRDQANLLHTSNLYYHLYQGQLAERLAKASGLQRVFFANTGTETTEGAMKLARAYQKRRGRPDQFEFVSLTNSFHGRSFGALSLTAQQKYREPFEPLVPGVRFIDADDFVTARDTITEKTAAIVIETIQGEGGIYPISDDFLKFVRARCDETGALLILDEVQCGLGRTGEVFAFKHTSVTPDILTVAKPLGMGIPLGAFMATQEVADGLQPGDHGSTFGGGPLACRMSFEFMKLLEEGGLMQRVVETGNYFRKKLRRLQRDLPEAIKEVRGLGLMVGVELNFPGANVIHRMRERGFLLNCTHDVTLRFLPPYIITKSEIKGLVEALAEVIPTEAAAQSAAGGTPRP
jgi:predicted acetylornithine/succinylornithine family transaminase